MSVKKTVCILAALMALTAVSAQESIELSDASTVIEETGVTPEKAAIPDFSLLLPLENGALPVLQAADIAADTLIESEAPGAGDGAGQDVFLEGAIGAGWPGFFSGDFSVYRNIGAEPFKLEFFHESVMGIGRHTAPDGYESQDTRLFGEKQFAFGDAVLFDAAAGYETRTDGLQGKNPGFYDLSRQTISGSAAFSWKAPELLSITGSVDGVFNTQFMSSSAPSQNTRTFMGVSSSAVVGFTGAAWNAGVVLNYDFGTEQSRFEAGATFQVDILDYATLAVSASSLMGKQIHEDVLIPFAISVATGPEAPFTASVSGGMRSYAVNPVTLEKETPFLFASTVPDETTEWFGEAAADIPVYGIGVLNLSAEFAKTAHNGGRGLPDYVALDAATGLVGLTNTSVMVLDSTVGVTIPLKVLNASIGWNANWIDNTSWEKTRGATSALKAGIYYAEEKGIWSAGADLLWARDCDPEIALTGCFQVTKAVRIELDAVDIVSLLTGKDRLICDTYADRGGYAALFVKVNF